MKLSRNSTLVLVALMLAVVACTCGPLSDAQEIVATGQAAATQVNEAIPSLEAEATRFAQEATNLAPTFQAEMTSVAATADALGVEPPAEATEQPGVPPTSGAEVPQNAIQQWAQSATASSEYGNPSWGAVQAAGEADTFECGDITTAWASASSNELATLTLTYAQSVIPTHVVIYQTYNPGAVTQVEAVEPNGTPHVVYTAQQQVLDECPFVLTVEIDNLDVAVNQVIVTIDQTNHVSWNEIDAVQLIGFPQ